MFELSFYIFSAFISYTDCTRYRVPNLMLFVLCIFLLVFGFFENKLTLSSFILPCLILVFFVVLLLLNRNIILGGGDIKYIVLIGVYLSPLIFSYFLIITGILQTLLLLYFQKIKKRKVAPMIPAIFISIMACDVFF